MKLKAIYSQFFSNEHKEAQDKIRNKNQLFKNLYEVILSDLHVIRDELKQSKKENEVLSKFDLENKHRLS